MIEPMTAAEWDTHRRIGGTALTPMWDKRIAAALEEREALLGEREEWGKLSGQTIQDAAVGALVRRIREHPESVAPVVHDGYGLDVFTVPVSEDGFRALLSHLDSLLPREPEVVTGDSGRQYRRRADGAVEIRDNDDENARRLGWIALPTAIYACDAPVVAKLLGGKDV